MRGSIGCFDLTPGDHGDDADCRLHGGILSGLRPHEFGARAGCGELPARGWHDVRSPAAVCRAGRPGSGVHGDASGSVVGDHGSERLCGTTRRALHVPVSSPHGVPGCVPAAPLSSTHEDTASPQLHTPPALPQGQLYWPGSFMAPSYTPNSRYQSYGSGYGRGPYGSGFYSGYYKGFSLGY